MYPFLEKRFSKDTRITTCCSDRGTRRCGRRSGAMAIALYIVLTFSAMNDIIALKFHVSLNATTWIGRIGMVVLPAIVYFMTYRWAISLQRSDRAVLEHGIETGILKRLPHGAYVELHQPLGPVDEQDTPWRWQYQGAAAAQADEQAGFGGGTGPRATSSAPTPKANTPRCVDAAHAGRTPGHHRPQGTPGHQRLEQWFHQRLG